LSSSSLLIRGGTPNPTQPNPTQPNPTQPRTDDWKIRTQP